jgi:large subunit ribosomal protein L10
MRTKQEKIDDLEQLRERLSRATSVVVADYRGLTVQQANDLRAKLRAVGPVEYRVAKNTLLRIAVRGTPMAGVEAQLEGPTAIAMAFDEPAAMARALVDYARANEKFRIKGGVVEGEVVDLDAIRALASLPSKDELRAKLMGTMLAPMQNLTSTLYALLGNLRNALEQRQKQIEAE